MYIPIQKNIYCQPCKECGARPVVEQLPKAKYKLLCPNNKNHFKVEGELVDNAIMRWNMVNTVPTVLREVS